MNKIQHEILPKGFEVIKLQIATLLLEELQHQYSFSQSPALKVDRIFIDRISPIDLTECPAINVSFVANKYQRKTALSTNAISTYHLDFYTGSVSSSTQIGDTRSASLLNRLMAVSDAILQHPTYIRLGLSNWIEHVEISEMLIADTSNTHDSNSVQMGRLILNVTNDVSATMNDLPPNIEGIDSVVLAPDGSISFTFSS